MKAGQPTHLYWWSPRGYRGPRRIGSRFCLFLAGFGAIAVLACTHGMVPVHGESAVAKGSPDKAPAASLKQQEERGPVTLASSGGQDRSPRNVEPTRIQAARKKAADKEVDPMIARGGDLFAKHCVICHGEAGDGEGEGATPRAHRVADPAVWVLRAPHVQDGPVDHLPLHQDPGVAGGAQGGGPAQRGGGGGRWRGWRRRATAGWRGLRGC